MLSGHESLRLSKIGEVCVVDAILDNANAWKLIVKLSLDNIKGDLAKVLHGP